MEIAIVLTKKKKKSKRTVLNLPFTLYFRRPIKNHWQICDHICVKQHRSNKLGSNVMTLEAEKQNRSILKSHYVAPTRMRLTITSAMCKAVARTTAFNHNTNMIGATKQSRVSQWLKAYDAELGHTMQYYYCGTAKLRVTMQQYTKANLLYGSRAILLMWGSKRKRDTAVRAYLVAFTLFITHQSCIQAYANTV